MNFDKPPVEPLSTEAKVYEPRQITNIANETTEELTKLLAKWKEFLEFKGGNSAIEAKIDLIERELKDRESK